MDESVMIPLASFKFIIYIFFFLQYSWLSLTFWLQQSTRRVSSTVTVIASVQRSWSRFFTQQLRKRFSNITTGWSWHSGYLDNKIRTPVIKLLTTSYLARSLINCEGINQGSVKTHSMVLIVAIVSSTPGASDSLVCAQWIERILRKIVFLLHSIGWAHEMMS